MQLLTLYECAVKEQSLLNYFKPSLNDRVLATTSTKLSFVSGDNNTINPRFLMNKNIKLEPVSLKQNTTYHTTGLQQAAGGTPSDGNQHSSSLKEASSVLRQSDTSITNTICKIDISDWIIKEDHPVKIFNGKRVLIGTFLSSRKAGLALGVTHTLVSRYAKSTSAGAPRSDNFFHLD